MIVLRGLQWVYNKLLAKAQKCLLTVLAAGPVPKHIAFVMDGNRRYARSRNKKVQQGHVAGFDALYQVRPLNTWNSVW